MSDEQLIELVKRYPVLYDMGSGQYRDHSIRNNAWEEIAEQINTTVEKCKERWGQLRNCFTNALKRRHKKSGQASTKIVPWKYEAQMEFLLPHIEGRRTFTNLSTDVNDDTTQESQFSEEPESPRADVISPTPGSSSMRTPTPSSFSIRTPTPSSFSVRTPTPTSSFHRTLNRNTKENDNNIIKEMVDVMKSSQESRQKRMAEMDETDHFFLSMSKQLKKLPKMDQTNIKFQMHKLIHDAEINMIKKSEQLLRTPLSVTRNLRIKYPNISFLNTTNTRTENTQKETNTQDVNENVVHNETAPNVIRNRTIQYPNTSHLNTTSTVTVNTQNKTNTQDVSENVVRVLTAPYVIRNRTIQYPNTSYLKTTNTGTVNTQNETKIPDVSENVELYETAATSNNTLEVEDDTQEIENETEETNLKEYYMNYNRY